MFQFLCPAGGAFEVSSSQPEPGLLDREYPGTEIRIVYYHRSLC